MSDLLRQVEADSTSADSISDVSTDKLKSVADIAHKIALKEDEVSQLEDKLKTAKKELLALTDEDMPLLMEEINLESFTLSDGSKVEIVPTYGGSIKVADRPQAHDWLRHNGFGDLIKRTAPAGGLSRDAQTRMLKNLTDDLLGETAGEFKGLQDPKIRGPYSTIQPGVNYTTRSLKKAAETGFFAPPLPKPKELSLYEKFLGRGRQVLSEVQKGKDALGNFTKSLQRSVQSKLGNSADALKKIGSTKIPGIGLLDKIPMGARRFVGKTLRFLGLFMLAREIEQDFRNGDINAVIVKLSAYGLGWLVTSAGLIAGSALGISGVGTLAGVAVLGGSIGAGAGTEMLIRKLFLENESTTPPKVKPTVTVTPKPTVPVTPKPDQQIPEIGDQSSTSKPTVVSSVNRNMSDGLNSPTTYGSQGIVKTREVVIALQRVEKEVLVPAA